MTKTIVITGLVIVVVLVIGVGLFRVSKNSERQTVNSSNNFVGKSLPNLELRDRDGQLFDWASLKNKNAVLFFNEGLMCYPACWDQMAAFGKDPRFNNDTTVAISVVTDSPNDWQRAIEKMPELAKEPTLFDTGAKVSRQLGFLTLGSSMHPGQLPGHTYLLVDRQGVVREVFDDANMAVNNDKIMEKMSKY